MYMYIFITAQFTAVQIGGNVIALKSVAFPQYFLGTDGTRLTGKVFITLTKHNIHVLQKTFYYS